LIDEVLCREEQFGQQIWYLTEALGSVYVLTDNDGNVVEAYHYSIYGSPKVYASDGTPRDLTNYDNRILFTSREYVWQFGLYYYRFRWYLPNLGAFAQREPLALAEEPFVSWYTYALCNPDSLFDPFGLLAAKDLDLWELIGRKAGRLDLLRNSLKQGSKHQQACDTVYSALTYRTLMDMWGPLVAEALGSVIRIAWQPVSALAKLGRHVLIAAVKAMIAGSLETFFKKIATRLIYDSLTWVLGKAFPGLTKKIGEWVRPRLRTIVRSAVQKTLIKKLVDKIPELLKGEKVSFARFEVRVGLLAKLFGPVPSPEVKHVTGVIMLNETSGEAQVILMAPICWDVQKQEASEWYAVFTRGLIVHLDKRAGQPKGSFPICVGKSQGQTVTDVFCLTGPGANVKHFDSLEKIPLKGVP